MAANGDSLKGPVIGSKEAFTGVFGAALGMLITYVTAVAGQSEQLARLSEKISNLEKQIQINMDDRYRGTDAARDFQLVNHQILEHEKRIETLEKHVNDYRRHVETRHTD